MRSDAPQQDELHEKVGEGVLHMQDLKHLGLGDSEHRAGGNGLSRGYSKYSLASHGFLAEEVAHGEQRNRRFLSCSGDDGELCPASLEIKDSVGIATLAKERLICCVLDDGFARAV